MVAYDFGCAGTESSFTSCSFQSTNANDACDHSFDASVVCGQIVGKLFSDMHSIVHNMLDLSNITFDYTPNLLYLHACKAGLGLQSGCS